MANTAKVVVHGVELTVDVDRLTKESLICMATTALTRRLSLGAKTKDEAALKEVAAGLVTDPNVFFTSTRGVGVSRPKLDIYERKAGSWFSAEFLPALKIGNEKAKALWAKAGGVSTVFKAKEDTDQAAKDVVDKNSTAKAKLIAAKAKKLKDSGWEPDLG